ncbi:hypothetical protein TWF694_003523 [Orbilia ellipsospora]|uniref:DUF3074 domain-containing protein n=1 Tax=Orbilia ellipsospora TaxID=2528407 RepID=A0AAV9X4E0_9PEZI
MSREAQLLVSRTPKPDIPAHWSLYLPYSQSTTTQIQKQIGKLIHVVGSPLHGYSLEFKASYIPSEDSIKRIPFPLCDFKDEDVKHTECYILSNSDNESLKKVAMGTEVEGWEGLDEFERVAMTVEAPGRVKGWNPLVPTKVGDRNCQWWMSKYIDVLIKEGMLGEEVYSNLDKIPETWDQYQFQKAE